MACGAAGKEKRMTDVVIERRREAGTTQGHAILKRESP